MGSKYKKSALKKMLTEYSKLQSNSDYNWLVNKNGQERQHILPDSNRRATRKCVKILIVAILAGLCSVQLLIFTFPNISPFYKHNVTLHYHTQDRLPNKLDINFGSHDHKNEDTTIADKLFDEVRVLCWIMTGPEFHATRAMAVKKTWGSRCNKLIFMSSEEDPELGAVALPVLEGRHELWGKTKEAFKYVYEHHFDEYDWFMKADDDTYVIVENLRKMLYEYSSEYPIYLGCKFKTIVEQGYMSGGAGYVLSREALKRFIEIALPDKDICRQDEDGAEDAEMGKCLENVEVLAGDSRDEYERGRMFAFTPDQHLLADPSFTDYWYWNAIYYKTDEGLDCCSDHAVSFHYVEPHHMYIYDYMIYHLRPFGITPVQDVLPEKKSLNEIKISLFNYTATHNVTK